MFSAKEVAEKKQQKRNNREQHKKVLETMMEKHGTRAGNIDGAIHDYMKSEVNIAITGSSGAGKSSLINSLRSLRPKDEGAAAVGVNETTMEPHPYPYAQNKNIVIWDLPGVGTPKFKRENYVDEVGLSDFEALILCTCTRFTEDDNWLVSKAKENDVRCYIVRTKIDIDVQNTLEAEDIDDDDADAKQQLEEEMLVTIRDKILGQTGSRVTVVYLLSTKLKHHTKWDFDDLNFELANNAPAKDEKALLMLLVSSSERVIDKKKEALMSTIDAVAEKAAHAPESEFRGIITREAEHYQTWFGSSMKELKRINMKINDLDKGLQDMQKEVQRAISAGYETTNEGSAWGWVPFFGGGFDRRRNEEINDQRRRDHEYKIRRMKDEVASRTPIKIKNVAINLLETFLENAHGFAIGILEARRAKV